MRTFTQQEINNFLLYHITELCNDYKRERLAKCDRNASYYFAQLMAYDNMAIVFGDCDTYNRVHETIRLTLSTEE